MSIGVIGQGFVGGSLTTVFSERGEIVFVHDKTGKVAPGGKNVFYNNGASSFSPKDVKEFVRSCEGVSGFSGVFFVCVPTPMDEDGSCNITIVEEVLENIKSATRTANTKDRIVVIKSTVPPGSTAMWNKKFNKDNLFVIFNPEFLTEANAVNDMREQTRIILGGPRPQINSVKQIYQRLFPKVNLIKTGSTTAEMVKYTTNCFLATKVSFANEISQICEALDADGLNIDYDKVIEYSKLDKRLGESHWSVPGPMPTIDGRYARGFSGSCFVKDINALITLSRQYNVEPTVMSAAWTKNLEVRGPDDRDWEKMIGRAVSSKNNK